MDKKSELKDYVHEWKSRKVAHPADLEVGFHFHNVEEWLEVLSGSGSFYRLDESEIQISKGDILYIPQGEIHKVKIGKDGLLYKMYIPMEISSSAFSNPLDRDEVRLMLMHLKLPLLENARDSGRGNNKPDEYAEVMLASLMSDGLSFRNKVGERSDKKSYLDRKTSDVERRIGRNGSLCVLHKCADCIVISSVVDVPGETKTDSVLNFRLLRAADDGWECTAWMNFALIESAPEEPRS